jgi:hypothetical protein
MVVVAVMKVPSDGSDRAPSEGECRVWNGVAEWMVWCCLGARGRTGLICSYQVQNWVIGQLSYQVLVFNWVIGQLSSYQVQNWVIGH